MVPRMRPSDGLGTRKARYHRQAPGQGGLPTTALCVRDLGLDRLLEARQTAPACRQWFCESRRRFGAIAMAHAHFVAASRAAIVPDPGCSRPINRHR